ncbi:MAG: Gfo/Idh/MocA family oxidoreductase [Oscillospiraceae bacterium]|nr:Gfo/Idh/MocA family oxidoreductase [Oscillospiraceae bacterium]
MADKLIAPPVGAALYGTNGHQIFDELKHNPKTKLIAVSQIDKNIIINSGFDISAIKFYDELDGIIHDGNVDFVSLCSPIRRKQATDAIKCLEYHKHVYAEKPCALTEKELDEILNAAVKSGALFHEMAGTTFAQPYLAMRDIAKSGILGDIMQVYAQKSYPYHNRRPQDEEEYIDGGLLRQAGVHAMRFIEHTAGVRIKDIYSIETKLGNPVHTGGMRTACSCMIKLENGGVANAVINYANPAGFGSWGNECLRIFGAKGFLESTDGGANTRLVIGEKDMGSIDISNKSLSYFDLFIDELTEKSQMPLSLDEELHPTRIVIRAKNKLI